MEGASRNAAPEPQPGALTSRAGLPKSPPVGAVAQTGERVVRNDEVRGSIPLGSTTFFI